MAIGRGKRVTWFFGVDLTELEKGWKQIDRKMRNLSNDMQKYGSAMSRNITAPLVGIGALALRETITFESAFARVRKTVNATEDELKALERGIQDMSKSMPSSATEIAAVASAAGQLGIQTENILSFSKTMVQLGEATNLSAEDAASSLAQFANVTQMNQRHFDRLGATIVDLGNNLATTERDIVQMAQRLAGTGKQVGMTEAQIMAMAGSLASVGIEAQAGGTSMSKLMVMMQLATSTGNKDLANFAAVAGMTAAQFKQAFEEDAAGAIISFITGLADLEGTGKTAIQVLDEMGITEVRLRDTLLRATAAKDIFIEAMKRGTRAWEENIALTKEAEEWYKTTGSQLKIMRNQMADVAREIGTQLVPYLKASVDKTKDLVEWFGNLSPAAKENTVKMGLLAAAIGPTLLVTTKLINAFRMIGPIMLTLASGPAAPFVIVASAAVYLAAKFTDAEDCLKNFNREIEKINVDKAKELQGVVSGGFFGKEGLYGSIAIAKEMERQAGLYKESLEDYQRRMSQKGYTTSAAAPPAGAKTPAPSGDGVLPDLTGGGSTKSGLSEIAKAINNMRDQMEYLNADGAQFAAILDQWKARLEPLSEDWKLISDLQREIADQAERAYAESPEGRTETVIQGLREEAEMLQATKIEQIAMNLARQQGIEIGTEYYQQILQQVEANEALKESMDIAEKVEAVKNSLMTQEEGIRASYDRQITVIQEAMDRQVIAVEEGTLIIANLYRKMGKELEAIAEETFDQKMAKAFEGWANNFASQLNDILWKADVTFEEIAVSFAKMVTQMMIQYMIVQPLVGWMMGVFGFEKGGVFSQGRIMPFARGGVVSQPTIFPMKSGLGLMGEAGPEAVMPLKRGSDGKLGVETSGEMQPVIINLLDKGDLEQVTYEAMGKYPGATIIVNHVLRAQSERIGPAFRGVR